MTETRVLPTFLTRLASLKAPMVLELGTLRWGSKSTHHAEWLPPGSTHVMSDVTAGVDVDVVSDAHDLAAFRDGQFDVVIACSVWEHLERPWLAAEAVARVLKPGGLAYISTHQTFPIHGYPSDYFRFSDEALKVLFGPPHFSEVTAGYANKATIVPPRTVKVWSKAAPAWISVDCMAVR